VTTETDLFPFRAFPGLGLAFSSPYSLSADDEAEPVDSFLGLPLAGERPFAGFLAAPAFFGAGCFGGGVKFSSSSSLDGGVLGGGVPGSESDRLSFEDELDRERRPRP
jgi:hypothetical protein